MAMTNTEIKTLITEANYRLNATTFTVQIDRYENDEKVDSDFVEEVTITEASNWIAEKLAKTSYKTVVTVYDYEAEAGTDGEVIFNQID